MTVKDIMQTSISACPPQTDLDAVVDVMKTRDCGFLPVVDTHGLVVGVITDRDVAIAAASKHRPLARISAGEAMSRHVFSCFATEHVKTALEMMAKHRVRRLPVLTRTGHLEGVLSIDDVVQTPYRRGGASAEDIVSVLKRIYARQPLAA